MHHFMILMFPALRVCNGQVGSHHNSVRISTALANISDTMHFAPLREFNTYTSHP